MSFERLPISVIILTFNSEVFIEVSLRSIADWVGEIFVVDSGSEDGTLAIVRRYTDHIISHPFENYAQQRNWAQNNLLLSFDWVFHLDSDEHVTPELRNSLLALFSDGIPENVSGFLIARRAVFLGKWLRYGGMYPVYHQRIYRRDKGSCENRLYDQHFVVQGFTKIINGDLIDQVTTDLDTWTKSHLRWATLEAHQQLGQSFGASCENEINPKMSGSPIEKRRWARVSLYGRAPIFFRAFAYFLYRYFLRLGFLDGTEGLIFHVLQGFWFRFYIDARIWEIGSRQ